MADRSEKIAKKADKFARRDPRMKALTEPGERFIAQVGMRLRTRHEGASFVWSDRALYIWDLGAFERNWPEFARIDLGAIKSVAYGQPPKGSRYWFEVSLPVLVINLVPDPVWAKTAAGLSNVQISEFRIREIPAFGVQSEIGPALAELQRQGIPVADHIDDRTLQ